MRTLILAMALAATTTACGSDALTGWSGIYTIDAWNRNDTSCADPGPSVLGTTGSTHFYIKNENFIIVKIVNVKECSDLAECQMQARDEETSHLGSFPTFEEGDGSDENGWTSRFAFGFPDAQSMMCAGSLDVDTMTQDATGIVLRGEDFDISFPLGSDPMDECPFEAAEAATPGPCTELEVIHGTLLEEI